jgi:hypothetical protein
MAFFGELEGSMNIRTLSTAALLALVVVLGAWHSGLTAAQTTQQAPSAPATGQPPPTSNMQDMMKMHEQMMAEMKAGGAKLDALVKEMNSATGDSKINAVAAVVNELVHQHKAMHGRMGQMHQHMMGGRGIMMRR